MMKPPMKLRRPAKISPVVIISVVVNAILIGALAYFFLAPKSGTSSGGYGTGGGSNTPTAPPAGGTVESLGRIQPSGGLISVYGPLGDKIVKFNVVVGETVGEDKVLAELAGETERNLNLATLKAQIKEAEALKKAIEASREAKLADIDADAKQALAGIEQDMAIIDAKVRVVEAQKARAETELKRLTDAKADGVMVSDQEFEALRIQVVQAEGEKAGALAQKEKITIQKTQSGESIKAKKASLQAETDRALAQVPTESLLAGKLLAERKLQDGQLRSPTSGRIVRILSKPGRISPFCRWRTSAKCPYSPKCTKPMSAAFGIG
jgi:multidrug efflux pump subunit AcrA (membrane-fusion protein)